jgi:bifunctional DNA-binding transcriptional regulator/antitoxin component of YhaV-PrlF toxin-antitoxin module
MDYTLEIQEDDNGDFFIQFPDDVIEELGWEEGDILEWKLKGNGVVLSKLNDSDRYEVIEE